jgi:glycosyltransferase involved in cell wall biosynthesis
VSEAAPRLRVGFLHIGRERSGVRRYGRILAAAAAERADLETLESDAGDRAASLGDLRRAARRLREADVVHLQWKLADWGPRTGGLPRMEVVMASLRRPVVVTLHDILPTGDTWAGRWGPGALGLRRLGRAAHRLVVHSEEERHRLHGLVPDDRVAVVPHFVESRPGLAEQSAARRSLGLGDGPVITLLGHVTRRRGHRLVIDALGDLPPDVTVLFVGSVIEGRDHVREELERHAAEGGVAGRVRWLGYVDEPTLDLVLAASDVGLCPFREMAASGALATWVSAGRSVVATDLPAIRELDALVPGALRTFAPYEPTPLACAIRGVLEHSRQAPDPLVAALAAELATPRIAERYARLYRAAA